MEVVRGYSFKKDLSILIDRILNDTNNLNCVHHLIVPDQFSAELEEFIINRTQNKAYINIHVESFTHFCSEILQDTFNDKLILSDIEQDISIRKILIEKNNELSIFKNKYNNDGFIEEIRGIISDINSVDIGIDELEEIDKNKFSLTLSQKLEDIIKVYREYANSIGNEYFSGNILQVSKKYVKDWTDYRLSIGKIDKMYILGFSDFSIAQLDLIEEFIKQFKDILFYFYIGTDTQDVTHTYNVVERYVSQIINRAIKNDVKVEAIKFEDNDDSFFRMLSLNIYDTTNNNLTINNEKIKIYELYNISSELKFVANRINEAIRSGINFDDIAILMGDVDSHARLIENIFQENNIPYFIDTNQVLTTSPIYKLVYAIYKIVCYGVKPENVIELMKYGYFFSDIEEVDDHNLLVGKVENFIIKTGIRTYNAYENIVLDEEDENYNYLKVGILYLAKIVQLIREMASSKITFKESIEKFRQICIELKLEDNLSRTVDFLNTNNESHKADQYGQLYENLDNCLQVLEENFAEEKNNIKLWLKLIVSNFNKIKLGRVPGSVNEVLVGNISRSMFIEKKHVFIIQANSGKLINSIDKYCIFNESDRLELAKHSINLNQNLENTDVIIRSKFLNILSRVTDSLEITYSRASLSGEEESKDPFIDSILNLNLGINITKIKNVHHNEPKSINQLIEYIGSSNITVDQLKIILRQIYQKTIYYQAKNLVNILEEKFSSTVDPNNLQINDKTKTHTISISQIEKYNTCPYAYFLSYILGVKERDEYRLSSLDKGNLYHSILEEFFKSTNLNDIKNFDLITLEKHIENHTYKYLEKYGEKFRYNFTNRNILSRIKDKLLQNLIDMREELSVLGADNIVTELPIFYKIDEKSNIKFTGKIDRVDKINISDNFENICRLYDYKSTSGKFEDKEINLGIKIQLLVYAKILDMQANHPIYLEYRSLKNKYKDMFADKMHGGKDEVIWINDGSLQATRIKEVLDENQKKNNKEKSREEFNALLDKSLTIMHETLDSIKEGRFDIKPYKINKQKNGCSYCQYSVICGFDDKNKNCKYRYANE